MKKLVVCILFLCMMSTVFAAGTFVTPGASAIASGSYLVNATMTINVIDNCTLNVGSSSTANTSVTFSAIVNDTADDLSFNQTINTTTFQDAGDYVFTYTCYNTSTSETATRTGITIDNTAPTAPSSVSPAAGSTQTSDDFTLSGTVVGATTTACTLYFTGLNPGSASYSMTHTGNTCSYSATNVPDQTYNYYITATDGLNSSSSSSTIFNVKQKDSLGSGAAGLILSKTTNPSSGELSVSSVESKPNIVSLKGIGFIGAGAVAGGVVGTAVFPIIGTSVGAVVGGVVGAIVYILV